MLVPKALADSQVGLSREHQRLKWEHYESIRREASRFSAGLATAPRRAT